MNRFLLLAIFGLLSACVNPYTKFYSGTPDARTMPNYENSGQQIQIFSSNDFNADVRKLNTKGYQVVGSSFFEGAANASSKEDILEQGKKIGAHIVLISSAYSRTITGVVPLSAPSTSTSYST